MTIMLLNSR